MNTATADLPDILEDRELTAVASASALYDRWERQHWAVAELQIAVDRPAWEALPELLRREMHRPIAELLTGETAVTETLTPLVDFAPRLDQRIFLTTQLADEAQHVQFFSAYQREAIDEPSDPSSSADDAFGRAFYPGLRRATLAVRETGGDQGAWYEALAHYHLVTEGVLASAALRSLLRLLRRVDRFPRLAAGLVEVARDESRHVQFGLGAAQAGVADGFGDRIAAAYLTASAAAVQVLVNPGTLIELPSLAFAAGIRDGQVHEQWDFARRKMLRNLSVIGLQSHSETAAAEWDRASRAAVGQYRDNFGREHPLARTLDPIRASA